MNKQIQMTSRAMEIADVMEKGVTTDSIIKLYSQKWNCSTRTVERMIALAKDVVIGRLRNPDMVLDVLRSESVSDDFANQLSSNLELHINLSRIAAGNATCKKVYSTKEGFKTVTVYPSINMQIKAIALLLRAREKMHEQQKEDSNEPQTIKPIPIKAESEEEQKIIDAI